jgi:hypothetical protein
MTCPAFTTPDGDRKAGSPLGEVSVVLRRRISRELSCPNVKFRFSTSAESVTIRAGPAIVVVAGLIQASMVMALLLWIASVSLLTGPEDTINVGDVTARPPGNHVVFCGSWMVKACSGGMKKKL